MHAALGVSQVQRLDEYVARRNVLAGRYDTALQSLPLQLPTVNAANRSAFHLYVVCLKPDAAAKTQRQVMSELRRRGVGVNLHYLPVHLQPYYLALGFMAGQYRQAEAFANNAFSLPLYPELTTQVQDQVIDALWQTLSHRGRSVR
jgi:dTDP-4-amino-4,6-dideoxygalactose transaminase